MYQRVRIIENKPSAAGAEAYRMELAAGDMARASQPGQFVMLKAWEGQEPFLMRPFSIHTADREAGKLTLLYKLVGAGTERMAALGAGDEVTVLGPLGHGFPLEAGRGPIALVGRGIGAAPLLYLAEEARRQGMEVYAYLSAKDEAHLYGREAMEAAGCRVRISCEAGGLVTDFFEQDLARAAFGAAYICGSKRLARAVRGLQKAHGFAAYVSLEEHMACGVGACKGCVCTVHEENGAQSYAPVCKSGPVFPLERIEP